MVILFLEDILASYVKLLSILVFGQVTTNFAQSLVTLFRHVKEKFMSNSKTRKALLRTGNCSFGTLEHCHQSLYVVFAVTMTSMRNKVKLSNGGNVKFVSKCLSRFSLNGIRD